MTDKHAPPWLGTIRTRVEQSWSGDVDASDDRALRPAAVLVLLIDSDDGPSILLTERATALTNYPGILVFPGGSAETADDGSVATAIREAAEETGIDPTHVHIIGSLPPQHLPDTNFVVTPVVGWCTELERTATMQSAEVAKAFQIPLREFTEASGRVHRNPATDTTGEMFSFKGTAVGHMTSAVIQTLLGQSL